MCREKGNITCSHRPPHRSKSEFQRKFEVLFKNNNGFERAKVTRRPRVNGIASRESQHLQHTFGGQTGKYMNSVSVHKTGEPARKEGYLSTLVPNEGRPVYKTVRLAFGYRTKTRVAVRKQTTETGGLGTHEISLNRGDFGPLCRANTSRAGRTEPPGPKGRVKPRDEGQRDDVRFEKLGWTKPPKDVRPRDTEQS